MCNETDTQMYAYERPRGVIVIGGGSYERRRTVGVNNVSSVTHAKGSCGREGAIRARTTF